MAFIKIIGPGKLTGRRIAEYEKMSRGVVFTGDGRDITELPEGREAQRKYADHLLGLFIAGDDDSPETGPDDDGPEDDGPVAPPTLH